jgi:hypothetical protein
MNKTKATVVVNKIIQKLDAIVGWGWNAFMLLALLITVSEDEASFDSETVIMFVFFFAIGFFFIWRGHKRKKLDADFKKYVAQLSADPTGQIENIAAATGTSVDVVKKDLKQLIDKRFFANAYIDEQNNQIVISSMINKADNTADMAMPNNGQASTAQEWITCQCPNCGGMNKIVKGMATECDFCGSPLQK